MNQFQFSFCDQTIKDNWIYKAYLQRVVDLARRHEIEAAGRVLITLTTVAASKYWYFGLGKYCRSSSDCSESK